MDARGRDHGQRDASPRPSVRPSVRLMEFDTQRLCWFHQMEPQNCNSR